MSSGRSCWHWKTPAVASTAGRVRVFACYRSTVTGANWQFSETKEYLQLLGILDALSKDDHPELHQEPVELLGGVQVLFSPLR